MTTSTPRDENPGETPDQRLARLLAEAERAKSDAAHLAAGEPGTSATLATVAGSGSGDVAVPAVESKRLAAHARAAAVKKAEEIKSLQAQIRAEMESRLRELEAFAGPLQKQIAIYNEAIWTINLYLGRDEEIVRLTEGAPAPADTPLTLRQEVLSMDEETAAYAEAGGIDARNIDVFDEWISSPVNLARVLPEPKGVVVLVPRRRGREYADPWASARLNEENRWSYFLIRNGENLYRMRTEFRVGKHLIPGTKEFTDLFYKTNFDGTRTELIPGTREWDKAAEAQDAKQRHYMRMALILQGLVDRTPVFHPLPGAAEEAPGKWRGGRLNLLDDRTYTAGAAHLLLDGEHVLGDGRPDFYTWLRDLNGNLRVGMRVMGAFNTEAFKKAGSEWSDGRDHHPNNRITPRPNDRWSQERPVTGAIYRLEGKKTIRGAAGFFFKFERTTKRWYRDERGEDVYRAPKTKGTCIVTPGDQFLLPFDLVTIEEMNYYLGARSQRHAYEEMFPLLQAAIAAKQEEAIAEAPFRTLLAGELIKAAADRGETLDGETAQTAVPALVDWWKLANKWHRLLVGTPEHPLTSAEESKAITAIVAEHAARTRQDAHAAVPATVLKEREVVDRLLAHDPTIMVIGRSRGGGYLAFAPQPRTYGPGIAAQNLWAVEYTTGASGKSIKTREWVLPGLRMDKTRLLHETEIWGKWDRFSTATSDLTDAEITSTVQSLAEEIEHEYATAPAGEAFTRRDRLGRRYGTGTGPAQGLVLAITHDPKNQTFEVWLTPAQDPDGLDETPSALRGNRVDAQHGRMRLTYEKSAREGLLLTHRDEWAIRWDSRHYGSSDAHPWGRVHDGRSRDPKAITTYPENQAIATARAARIKAHNKAIDDLRRAAREPLNIAHREACRRKQAETYARFLDDYADPELWEGHQKTLKTFDLEPYWHPQGRALPEVVLSALYALVDKAAPLTEAAGVPVGTVFEGHTVRTALESAGHDVATLLAAEAEADKSQRYENDKAILAQMLDLPLWEPQTPESEEAAR